MSERKYIIFSDELTEFPVIFPSHVIHRNIGNALRRAGLEPVSAGFVDYNFVEDNWNTYGRSESLDLDSRPDDGIIITKFFYS